MREAGWHGFQLPSQHAAGEAASRAGWRRSAAAVFKPACPGSLPPRYSEAMEPYLPRTCQWGQSRWAGGPGRQRTELLLFNFSFVSDSATLWTAVRQASLSFIIFEFAQNSYPLSL